MVSNVETLFNPRDDSLAEKVKAYYEVCRDYHRVQASLNHTKQGKNTDFIGDHDEVVTAYDMISNSLSQASMQVSSAELQKACVFQRKVATDSRGKLPPIPREGCHPFQ